jgi:hypothetical protein
MAHSFDNSEVPRPVLEWLASQQWGSPIPEADVRYPQGHPRGIYGSDWADQCEAFVCLGRPEVVVIRLSAGIVEDLRAYVAKGEGEAPAAAEQPSIQVVRKAPQETWDDLEHDAASYNCSSALCTIELLDRVAALEEALKQAAPSDAQNPDQGTAKQLGCYRVES